MGATTFFSMCSCGDIYKPSDFPFDFESKYSSVICHLKQLSKMQIKKLFEIGVMKIAIMTDDNFNNYNLLTDEAFDYQFPTANGFVDNKIKIIFKTKENMHSYIEKIINQRL